MSDQENKKLCAYCRTPLNDNYYFCLRCAQPYKAEDTILPPMKERPLSQRALLSLKAPAVAPLFWTYLAIILFVGIPCSILFQKSHPALTLLFPSIAMATVTLGFSLRHWRVLLPALKNPGFQSEYAYLGLIITGVLLIINYGMAYLLHQAGLPFKDDFQFLPNEKLNTLLKVLLVCVSPAIIEETAFRGLMLPWLFNAFKPLLALALSSALFAALHFSILSFPYLFLLGMALGWIRWKTNSLYPSIVMHFVHNYIVIEFFKI